MHISGCIVIRHVCLYTAVGLFILIVDLKPNTGLCTHVHIHKDLSFSTHACVHLYLHVLQPRIDLLNLCMHAR